MPSDRRLIEDFLPLRAIRTEALLDPSVRNVKITALHLWCAQHATSSCRARLHGALLSSESQFRENSPDSWNQENQV